MPKIYLPATSPDEFIRLLAAGEKHWKPGYSAWALAHCWMDAKGFPPEVMRIISTSGIPSLSEVELLLAIPEHPVPIPPTRGHPSQNDLFVLARTGSKELVSIMVEGKVEESFGPTLGEWKTPLTKGKAERLNYLMDKLNLTKEPPSHIRYQFFHRMVSAVFEAERFSARYAIMIVHSFSQKASGFDDFGAFLSLFGAVAVPGKLVELVRRSETSILAGWAQGEGKYLLA